MNWANVNLFSELPIYLLSGTIIVALLAEAFMKKSAGASYWISLTGIFAAMFFSIPGIRERGSVFGTMIIRGGYGSFFDILFLSAALFTIILSREYLARLRTEFGEFYILILLATLGMMLMASAADLIMVFLGLELMSICLYVLAGFFRKRMKSNESSLKYFLLGAFSTGFLLYGIALLFGAAHTTNINSILSHFSDLAGIKYFWIGVGMFLIGLSFKVAAVPFHMWVPDVYEGSPTPVSGFMATGAKAAAFGVFVLVFANPLEHAENLRIGLGIIAAASMIFGNIVAISQTNLKRMLAYSSIGHAGYMLIGITAMNQLGREGTLFYVTCYLFMNLGAFGVIGLLEEDEDKNLQIGDYAGLGHKRPFLAALMAVFMLTLSGLPPFGGFFGKYYIFLAAINSHLTWLAVVGVLTSVIGAFYYIRVIVSMYFQDGGNSIPIRPSGLSLAALAIAAFAIIQLGVYPSFVLSVIQQLFY